MVDYSQLRFNVTCRRGCCNPPACSELLKFRGKGMGTVVLQIEWQGVTGNKLFLHFSGVRIGGPANGDMLIHPCPELCRSFVRRMELGFVALQLRNALASEIRQQCGEGLANRRAAFIAPKVIVTETTAQVSVL